MTQNKIKIDYDKETLKILASPTRILILKLIEENPKTVTDISKELGISKSAIHNHLIKLSDIGFIKRIDNSNKWVYYEITEKYKTIIHHKIYTIFTITFLLTTFKILNRYLNTSRVFERTLDKKTVLSESKSTLFGFIYSNSYCMVIILFLTLTIILTTSYT